MLPPLRCFSCFLLHFAMPAAIVAAAAADCQLIMLRRYAPRSAAIAITPRRHYASFDHAGHTIYAATLPLIASAIYATCCCRCLLFAATPLCRYAATLLMLLCRHAAVDVIADTIFDAVTLTPAPPLPLPLPAQPSSRFTRCHAQLYAFDAVDAAYAAAPCRDAYALHADARHFALRHMPFAACAAADTLPPCYAAICCHACHDAIYA